MTNQSGQIVNAVGKYIYRHIDGAYKISFSPNTCDVYMLMYYQAKGEEMQEMKFDISITTYQNKIRINLNEMTFLEKTIGQDIYKPEQVEDLQKAYPVIYNKLINHIKKEYADYEFVF